MRELFFFDIETVGNYSTLEDLRSSNQREFELFEKKFQKMKWDEKYDSIDEAYLDNAGIISTFGKIVCISCGYKDNNGEMRISSIYGDDEKDIVDRFNQYLKKIELKNFDLSGFRILYFDIPWIIHKLHKYDIIPADIISHYQKKPWEMRITDLSDDWKFKFAWSPSFDEVVYELGLKSPKSFMNGSDVHVEYHKGNLERIKDYCEEDVRASIEVADKMYKK
jgi:hypothetical protein